MIGDERFARCLVQALAEALEDEEFKRDISRQISVAVRSGISEELRRVSH